MTNPWDKDPIISANPWQEDPVEKGPPPSGFMGNAGVTMDTINQKAIPTLFGAPVDLATMWVNGLIDRVNPIVGEDHQFPQITEPLGGSSSIRSGINKLTGGPLTDESTWTPKQMMASDILDFGAQALLPGLGLAGKARSVEAGASKAGPLMTTLIEPYMKRPAAQVAQDVASGMGAGGGAYIAEDQDMGPIGTLFATLLGGGASSIGHSVGEGAFRGIQAAKKVALPNGVSAKGSTIDDARQIMQNVVTDKDAALKNIDESLAMNREMGIADPTLGPASGDVGLSMMDVQRRTANPRPFQVRDQQVRTDVADTMNKLSNSEADVTAPQVKSQAIIDQEMMKNQNKVNDLYGKQTAAEQQVRDLDKQAEELAAPIAGRRGEEGRASRLLNEQIGKKGGALDKMTEMRKQAIESVDPEGKKMVETDELGKAITSLNDDLNNFALNKADTGLPADFVSRVDAMTKKLVTRNTGLLDETGAPLISSKEVGGKVSLKDIQDMRKPLPDAISRAERAGNFDLAKKLKGVAESIDTFLRSQPDEAVQSALSANDTYMQFFGKQQSTARAFRDLVQRNSAVGTADPDNIAEMFLNNTKGAKDDLNKLREVVPDQKAFDNAEEMYFDAILAKKDLNPKSVRQFMADNQDTLPPRLKEKYQNLVKDMMSNRQLKDSTLKNITDLKKSIREAEVSARSAESQLRAGPFGKMSAQDSDRYIGSILASPDRTKQIKQVVASFKGDKKAADGFKEALLQHLYKKVKGTAPSQTSIPDMDGAGRPVIYNKLSNIMNEHRDVLADVFSPKEMNTLNRINTLMAKQGNLSRRATVGSDTAEKLSYSEEQALNLVNSAVNIKFGLVQGGMVNRVIRSAAKQLFSGQRKIDANELLTQAALNPEVAKVILNATPRTLENGSFRNDLVTAMAVHESIENNNENKRKLTP